ncbi:MAG: hypothetical protein RLY86_644 [Pseudomonadota bacterium]|jgi:UDP-N-acetyl-D-glucosamine dehydrogenase
MTGGRNGGGDQGVSPPESHGALLARIEARKATVGIIGLGYVGLPLVIAFAAKGFPVLGFDIDPTKVEMLNTGRSYLAHIPSAKVAAACAQGLFTATDDFSRLAEADAILICVPTPLTRQREPDLRYVERTASQIAAHLRPGQVIILESTTYPGTTSELLRPILERTGLRSGIDFFLGYSPEREDPGNPDYETSTIPKIVGGDGPWAASLVQRLYDAVISRTVRVSSCETAEAVKLTENIFRSVNIALVNELKVVYEAMGVDIWEVIEAAKTKPFGYMPFYPGPGLGGHCIPIDPFYLTWKAREYDIATRFIELAGEINTAMPHRVVEKLAQGLDSHGGRGLSGARILVIGVAYKKNIDDTRESPAFRIIELLERRGAEAAFHDPLVPVIPDTRQHAGLAGRQSVPLTEDLSGFQAALICTDHDAVDYALLARRVPLIVDTRNACAARGITGPVIIKA